MRYRPTLHPDDHKYDGLRSRATMRVKSQSEKTPLSVTKALAEATLSSMSFHLLRYLLALAVSS
jgi:hypothetical protein